MSHNQTGQRIFRAAAPLAACAALLCRCEAPAVIQAPESGMLRTAHFVIHYHEHDFSPFEIERIGVRKEKLLDSVNAYLQTSFDGVIEVCIHDSNAANHATVHGHTFERPAYARADNGHEIAHVVCFQEWGFARNTFMAEGVAVACEAFGATAVQKLKSALCSGGTEAIAAEGQAIRDALCDGAWRATSAEYLRAGAFVDFVRRHWGVARLKAWYRAMIDTQRDTLGGRFQSTVGLSLTRAIDMFKDSLHGSPYGRGACDVRRP
jgi:hypothetical protein